MFSTKFSIIIPVYNAEKTIRTCLRSILGQTYTDFEVIIINDGSTDKTLSIVKTYEKLDPRITVYSYANAGVSEARHRGIINANGQYIIFVDSDDEINAELLANLKETIDKYQSPDIIRFQCELVNDVPYKNHDRYNYHDKSGRCLSGIAALKKWSMSDRKYAVYWLYAFKRSICLNVQFPRLNCYEDVAVIPILVANAKSVVTIDYVGYKYTYNNLLSITNKKGLDHERKRALDFLTAYKYAIINLRTNTQISDDDFAFLVEDYNLRLLDKYNSLPKPLKKEMKKFFMFV